MTRSSRSRPGKGGGAAGSSAAAIPEPPKNPAGSDASPGRSHRKRWIAISAAILAIAAVLAGTPWLVLRARDAPAGAVATFVGSAACGGCHRSEAALWTGSQHQRAMQHAGDTTVLGDFADASFDYHGARSRFFRRDGKYLVETDGADGKLATFEVKYTFGVDPLQQYLVEFPDGRVQALPIAWDTRPKDKGGQRWFHLYPDEDIKHDDVLHWTKLSQNWNFMCAECHSTGVRKNYDATNNRFATTFAEISVGCEACHGQGSRHVAWAREQQSWWPFGKHDDPTRGLLARFDEREGIVWRHDATTGNPTRNIAPAMLRKEVETCGLCHARRAEFSEDWVPGRPLSDTHFVSPLARGLYFADGQMRDEVYNYGSFKQSRMFTAGVTCGDCHEPHAAKLRAQGDGVCLQCHAPATYAAASHHHHAGVEPPPGCPSCHMPARTYMVVDRRHDHSLRIPRPDLSAKLGTPNACNDCHADKSPQWAAAAIENWHAPERKGFQNYAEAFDAAWSEKGNAGALLAAVASDHDAPAFARAGALSELGPYLAPASLTLIRSSLSDPDPMVRIGALDALSGIADARLWSLVAPLLADPVRGVRIRAASLLAPIPTERQPEADRASFERAAAEFVAAQRLNADRPEARATLGNFLAARNQRAEAEAEFKAALRLDPHFAPAAVNLADFYRQGGRDAEGESVLRTAIAATPADAGLHYTLGLTLTRLKRPDEALAEFRHAAELEPQRARYGYVYAVALHSGGRGEEAKSVLKAALARHPGDRDVLLALVTFNRDAGDIPEALTYAERLAQVVPDDRQVAALVQTLRGQSERPGSR